MSTACDGSDYYPLRYETVLTCAECPKLRQRVAELEHESDALKFRIGVLERERDEALTRVKELLGALSWPWLPPKKGDGE